MLIILEGPDGAGKTTLANTLRSRIASYLWLIRTNSRPHHKEEMTLIAQWLKDVPHGLTLVCDRHPFISEEVYGFVLRDSRPFITSQPDKLGDLAKYLADVLVIYCRPQLRVFQESARQQPQMIGVLANLSELVRYYDELMWELRQRGVQVLHYNFEDLGNIDRTIDQVKQFIREGSK